MSSPSARVRRICLFGTSANPPTSDGGHVGIVRALLGTRDKDDQPLFDQVHVVPVYKHMYASKRHLLSKYEHRMEMCRLAFADLDGGRNRVVVSDAEEQAAIWAADGAASPEPIGTAVLLQYLHQNDEKQKIKSHYSFCLGADAFCDFLGGKWTQEDEILEAVQGRIVVIPRPEHDESADDILEGKIQEWNSTNQEKYPNEADGYFSGVRMLDVPSMQPISSSKVRATSDVEELKKMVVPDVLEYMQTHQLYGFAPKSDKEEGGNEF